MLSNIILQMALDPEGFGLEGMAVSGTVGSIVTMVVQHFLNKKKDKADMNVINYDVIDKQFKSLWENLEHQGEVIKELQTRTCYRDPCPTRVNGEAIPVKPKVHKKQSA